MLHLTFYEVAREPAACLELADFRVTGGALWNSIEPGLIATHHEGTWNYRGRLCTRLKVRGGACLLFGISRDPTIVSLPMERMDFTGPVLSANGVAIARYAADQDMWHGVVRPMWWTAMRIVSASIMSTLLDRSKVVVLDPWTPRPRYSLNS